MGSHSVDVTSRQREAATSREAFPIRRPAVPAEHDLRGKHVIRKPWDFRELVTRERG